MKRATCLAQRSLRASQPTTPTSGASLEWARDSDEGEVLLRLAAALAFYWGVRSAYHEASAWTRLALERASSPPQARMTLLRVAASQAMDEKDFARSEALVAEHRRLAEELGDEIEILKAMNMAAGSHTSRAIWKTLRTNGSESGSWLSRTATSATRPR